MLDVIDGIMKLVAVSSEDMATASDIVADAFIHSKGKKVTKGDKKDNRLDSKTRNRPSSTKISTSTTNMTTFGRGSETIPKRNKQISENGRMKIGEQMIPGRKLNNDHNILRKHYKSHKHTKVYEKRP